MYDFMMRSENLSGSEVWDSADNKHEINEFDSEHEQLLKEKKELDEINNCKKFFYDINLEDELNNDIDSDELELLSDDEI